MFNTSYKRLSQTMNVVYAAHCWQHHVHYFLCDSHWQTDNFSLTRLNIICCFHPVDFIFFRAILQVSCMFVVFILSNKSYLMCMVRRWMGGKKASESHVVFERIRPKHYFCFDWDHCLKFSSTLPCGISCASNLYSQPGLPVICLCLSPAAWEQWPKKTDSSSTMDWFQRLHPFKMLFDFMSEIL